MLKKIPNFSSLFFNINAYLIGQSKEYISLVEGTATSHRLQLEGLTQPLPACSVGSYTDGQVVQYTADRAGRGWVSQIFVCRVLSLLYHCYIFFAVHL